MRSQVADNPLIMTCSPISVPRYIMAAPPEFRAAFLAALVSALPRLIEIAWDKVERKTEPKSSPRQRAAVRSGRRIQKGRLRSAVQDLIGENDKEGLTRENLRKLVVHRLDLDGAVSESSLKRALMDLRATEKIETRNSRWHLTPPSYLRLQRGED
jgi:hypothetical protein